MLWMAFGGTLIALSVLLFIIVATGTYVANVPDDERQTFGFAPAEEEALPTPPVLDNIGRWATIAIVLAVLAYAGPLAAQISAHAPLAPGMRTW
jgi:fructose-specific phosphotransferase system IIC component